MSRAPWTCDSCGHPIISEEDGWVEWIEFKTATGRQARDLRLVHHMAASPTGKRCQFNQQVERNSDGGLVADASLSDFLGSDGLMELLAMLEEARLPRDEVIEMIKRLHVEGYEQARPYFEEAISEGVFEPNTLPGYYRQSDIQAVLEFTSRQ